MRLHARGVVRLIFDPVLLAGVADEAPSVPVVGTHLPLVAAERRAWAPAVRAVR